MDSGALVGEELLGLVGSQEEEQVRGWRDGEARSVHSKGHGF